MSKIQEIIVESNRIEVGSTFKLKVRVIDSYKYKKIIISENKRKLLTEDGKIIRSEWGDLNE